MISMMTRNQVEQCITAPESRRRFDYEIMGLAIDTGADVLEKDVEELAKLAARYVRETLRLLESCATAAAQARADQMIAPVIGAAERFFLQPHPRVPDYGGLFGVVCSAYMARELLKQVSDQTRETRGFPLIASDPHSERFILRKMLGEDIVAELDDLVEDACSARDVRLAFSGAYDLCYSLRASGRVDEWGASWVDEMARYAGAMGLNGGDRRAA